MCYNAHKPHTVFPFTRLDVSQSVKPFPFSVVRVSALFALVLNNADNVAISSRSAKLPLRVGDKIRKCRALCTSDKFQPPPRQVRPCVPNSTFSRFSCDASASNRRSISCAPTRQLVTAFRTLGNMAFRSLSLPLSCHHHKQDVTLNEKVANQKRIFRIIRQSIPPFHAATLLTSR